MLPASWRKRNGVGPAAELLLRELKTGALVVETREQAVQRAQALVRRYVRLKPGASLVDEFLRERRQEAARESSE